MTLYKQDESPTRTMEGVAQILLAAIFVVLLNSGLVHARPTVDTSNQFSCESLAQHNSTSATVASRDGALLVDETDNAESSDSHAMILFARGGECVQQEASLLTSHRTEWRASSFFLRTSNRLFRP